MVHGTASCHVRVSQVEHGISKLAPDATLPYFLRFNKPVSALVLNQPTVILHPANEALQIAVTALTG